MHILSKLDTVSWKYDWPSGHTEHVPRGEGIEDIFSYDTAGKLHGGKSPAVIKPGKYKAYYLHGILHRLDGPAIEYDDGRVAYWIQGMPLGEQEFQTFQQTLKTHSSNLQLSWKVLPGYHHKKEFSNRTVYCNEEDQLHRTDGPAIEWTDGDKEWWIDGKLHRLDGPAIEYVDGSKWWYIDGKLHRLDGPAIEWTDGDKEWWIDGKLHRLDGPAKEFTDGSKSWYQNGKLHRLDGPAVEWLDGSKWWYIDGEKLTEEGFNQRTRQAGLKLGGDRG